LKADRFQLCVAQLAAVDLHESNATSSLAKFVFDRVEGAVQFHV
jgi:hypothetical protein